ncbi:MAG: hypothetical protein KF729_33850 [Sandaracinaceae bacterium]|nr:hypothetical protein [Sandaracinaceae bacterium]
MRVLALTSALLGAVTAHAQEAEAEALLGERGCLACHSLDGAPSVGPTFARAAARPGFDVEHVRESILEPDAVLAPGYPEGAMPRLARSPEDAAALAAAVMVLARREPPPASPARAPWLVVLASLAFVLGHFVLSSRPVREPLIARLGARGFTAGYSLLVLAAFVWLLFEWVYAPYVELFRPPGWTRWIPNVVMPFAYVLLVAGFTTKSPTVAGADAAAEAGPIGIVRITRHPALWGFAAWGLSHLATNGDLRSLALMGGLAVLALGGMLHIDSRRRASGGAAWRAFEDQTSVLPFAAILRGQPWPTLRELGLWRVAVGVVGWAAMLHLHRAVIGVGPLP